MQLSRFFCLWQLVDERFNEEETKFKMLEGAVKNIARDISVYLEQLDVSSSMTYLLCVRSLSQRKTA